jgi:cytochrome o ubiquinol oxidase subunit IV
MERELPIKTMIWRAVAGFVISLVLTLAAYFLVTGNTVTGLGVLIVLGALALMQFFAQMIFFLHIGDEKRPRYKRAAALFMGVVLVIIVGGSLWIMYNLNYNMMQMEPMQKDEYMNSQRDKGF